MKLKTPFTFAGYSFTGRGSLFDADNEMVIIGIDSEQGQEIARRVNAYDALIALAESLLRGGMRETEERIPEIRAAARDALALVRGEADDA